MAGPFLFDRVKETTAVTSTGTATLLGATTGYQDFSVVGNSNTTYYCIAHQTLSEWEVGIGTYTASGTTLARTTVIASSNSNNLVNFSAGTKDVFITVPASRVYTGTWSSINQLSTNNAGTPLTKFDLLADQVTTWNPTTNAVSIHNSPGTITNDVGLTGPAANGRDQAGAFSSSSWIHFYWIWNGTTLASISSAVAPMTGPTLPATYTEWAYGGAVRFDGSSHLMPVRFQGNTSFYVLDINGGGVTNALSGGTATTFTAIDLSTLMPPNTRRAIASFYNLTTNTGAGSNVIQTAIQYRPTGSGLTNGIYVCFGSTIQAGVYKNFGQVNIITNSAQSIDYKNETAAGGTPTYAAYLDIVGYYMPNNSM